MSRVCEVLDEQKQQTGQQELREQTPQETALVPIGTDSDDGWQTAATEADSRWIQGTLIQFADWRWTQGSEKIEVEKGRKLGAVGVRSVWVKWKDRKPVDYRTAPPSRLLPSRESLGDLDEGLWERDPKGDPKDPWANTRYVYLVCPNTAEALTFCTSSVGGRRCVEDLARSIEACGENALAPRQSWNSTPLQCKPSLGGNRDRS